MTQFNIGDTAYHASVGMEHIWIACPECLGSGRLRVILGDNSEVSIACICCERGYGGSPGKIETYKFEGRTSEVQITGIESSLTDKGLRTIYKINCWVVDEKDIFSTREEAQARTTALVTEHEAEETKRLKYKEKQHKTWAWNVHYWRGIIRRAKDEIARAEARLAVAPKNPKEADK